MDAKERWKGTRAKPSTQRSCGPGCLTWPGWQMQAARGEGAAGGRMWTCQAGEGVSDNALYRIPQERPESSGRVARARGSCRRKLALLNQDFAEFDAVLVVDVEQPDGDAANGGAAN